MAKRHLVFVSNSTNLLINPGLQRIRAAMHNQENLPTLLYSIPHGVTNEQKVNCLLFLPSVASPIHWVHPEQEKQEAEQ